MIQWVLNNEKAALAAIFSLFLCGSAWQDIKKQEISVWIFVAAGAAALLIRRGISGDMAFSASLGLVLFAVSRLMRGAVGEGDSLFFLVSGLFLPAAQNLMLFFYGLFLCSLAGLVILADGVRKKKNVRKQSVPFLPFLLPVWIWMVVV